MAVLAALWVSRMAAASFAGRDATLRDSRCSRAIASSTRCQSPERILSIPPRPMAAAATCAARISLRIVSGERRASRRMAITSVSISSGVARRANIPATRVSSGRSGTGSRTTTARRSPSRQTDIDISIWRSRRTTRYKTPRVDVRAASASITAGRRMIANETSLPRTLARSQPIRNEEANR